MFINLLIICEVMKLQYTIVLATIIIGSIGAANLAFVSNTDLSTNALKSTAMMVGHLTLTAVNEDGDIIAYRQTDNVVVNNGDNCIAESTFGGDWSCGAPSNPFLNVHIGTATAAFSEASTGLVALTETALGTLGTPLTATSTTGAHATITATFVDVGNTIAEAALRNGGSTTSDLLAINTFTPISLGANDDLTIDWTVTIDG